MYQSVIGKRFVRSYNQRENTDYSVLEFFNGVYIPLFFGSARLMQNVSNSPFYQVFTARKQPFTTALMRKCLQDIHDKVRTQAPDGSFFLGGPAAGSMETTSGQVTAMQAPISEEDVYASWIGAALGLTVQGGLTLLIDSEDVLLATYDGWKEYRRLLDQTPKLKSLQVNTWNGQWVINKMTGAPMFDPIVDAEGTALQTQSWIRLLFALSKHFRNDPDRRLLTYVYLLGQSNSTIGFVQLNLPEVRRLADIYAHFFTVPAGMHPADFTELYQTSEAFTNACTYTEIGLKALKPKDVFKAERGIPKPPNETESEKWIVFDIYQTWIIAMLNNKDLVSLSLELASALHQFQQKDDRGKSVRTQIIEELLDKKSRREFIECLPKLLEKDGSDHALLDRSVSELMALSNDSVPLFLTLLRFKYAVVKAKASQA